MGFPIEYGSSICAPNVSGTSLVYGQNICGNNSICGPWVCATTCFYGANACFNNVNTNAVCACSCVRSPLISGTTTCGLTAVCGGTICATGSFYGAGTNLTGTATSLTVGCATNADTLDGYHASELTGSTVGNFYMSGDTVGGVTTYVDGETICSEPNLVFTGSCLNVNGRLFVSASGAGSITGSTVIICATTCKCGDAAMCIIGPQDTEDTSQYSYGLRVNNNPSQSIHSGWYRGIIATAVASTPHDSGRAVGVIGAAGGMTSGYNIGVWGYKSGTCRGAGVVADDGNFSDNQLPRICNLALFTYGKTMMCGALVMTGASSILQFTHVGAGTTHGAYFTSDGCLVSGGTSGGDVCWGSPSNRYLTMGSSGDGSICSTCTLSYNSSTPELLIKRDTASAGSAMLHLWDDAASGTNWGIYYGAINRALTTSDIVLDVIDSGGSNLQILGTGDICTAAGITGTTWICGGDIKGDQFYIRGQSTNNTFTSPGPLAIKEDDGVPYITFHDNDGTQHSSIEAGADCFSFSVPIASACVKGIKGCFTTLTGNTCVFTPAVVSDADLGLYANGNSGDATLWADSCICVFSDAGGVFIHSDSGTTMDVTGGDITLCPVGGKAYVSTCLVSPVVSGQTVCGSTLLKGTAVCGTSCVRSPIVSGTTVCALTCLCVGASTDINTNTVLSTNVCGATLVCGATIRGTTICGGTVCATTCAKGPKACYTNITGQTVYGSTLVCGASVCGTTLVCGGSCLDSPVVVTPYIYDTSSNVCIRAITAGDIILVSDANNICLKSGGNIKLDAVGSTISGNTDFEITNGIITAPTICASTKVCVGADTDITTNLVQSTTVCGTSCSKSPKGCFAALTGSTIYGSSLVCAGNLCASCVIHQVIVCGTGGVHNALYTTDGCLVSGATGGGLSWSGSQANGIGTFVDASTICANTGLTFNGSTLVFGQGASRTICVTQATDGGAGDHLYLCGGSGDDYGLDTAAAGGNVYVLGGRGSYETGSTIGTGGIAILCGGAGGQSDCYCCGGTGGAAYVCGGAGGLGCGGVGQSGNNGCVHLDGSVIRSYVNGVQRGYVSVGSSCSCVYFGASICITTPIVCGTNCMVSPYMCLTTGMSISSSTGYKLCVTNGCGTAVDWTATSDCRLKKNIAPISNALSIVNCLCGICYDFCIDNSPNIGLIAQDVEKIEPRLVTKGKSDEEHKIKYGVGDVTYGLKYDKFAGLFVEAIKELKQQNEQLQKRIDCLENIVKEKNE